MLHPLLKCDLVWGFILENINTFTKDFVFEIYLVSSRRASVTRCDVAYFKLRVRVSWLRQQILHLNVQRSTPSADTRLFWRKPEMEVFELRTTSLIFGPAFNEKCGLKCRSFLLPGYRHRLTGWLELWQKCDIMSVLMLPGSLASGVSCQLQQNSDITLFVDANTGGESFSLFTGAVDFCYFVFFGWKVFRVHLGFFVSHEHSTELFIFWSFTLDITSSGPPGIPSNYKSNYKEQRAGKLGLRRRAGTLYEANWRPLYHLDIATPDHILESSQAPKCCRNWPRINTGLVANND